MYLFSMQWCVCIRITIIILFDQVPRAAAPEGGDRECEEAYVCIYIYIYTYYTCIYIHIIYELIIATNNSY